MDVKRMWITMLVFLFVSLFIWAGFSVYFSVSTVDIHPNAQTLTTFLKANFDNSILDDIDSRIEKLPVKPSSFSTLNSDSTENK